MGLREKAELGGMSLSLYDGKICQKVSSEVPGSVSRTNKDGKIVHERYFESLDGYLVYLEKIKHQEYGDAWMVHLHDGTDAYKLRLAYTGRQTDGLLRRLPDIKLKKKISIVVGSYQGVPFLVIMQDGKKVPFYWTKENPGELPPMKEIEVNNKKIWDHSMKMEYLEKYVDARINSTLNEMHPNKQFNANSVEGIPKKKVMDSFDEAELPKSDIQAPTPQKDGYS